MSFSFEYHALVADVPALMEQEKYIPQCVKDFIVAATRGLTTDVVFIKANGHLFDGNSYQVSNASIEVKPIVMRELKPVPAGVSL